MADFLGVSVVTVGYRGAGLLERCLASVLASEPRPREVLVVDNASPEDLTGVLGRFSTDAARCGVRALTMRSDRNLGFGGGCALALKATSEPLVFLLNPDTVLEPETLGLLVEAGRAAPQPAALQPLVVFAQERGKVNSAGVAALLDGGFVDMLCGAPRSAVPEGPLVPIAAATGAAVLLRRQDIDRLGFFDPDFFLYIEDVDLGLRWRRAGAQAFLVPGAVVYHEYHGSSRGGRADFAASISQNQLETVAKNYPPLELCVAALLWSYNTAMLLAGRGPPLGRARLAAAAGTARRWRALAVKRRGVRATGPDARIAPWIVAPRREGAAAPPLRR
ncbi:MAG TPA: glycosyltransferase family 2 protein [Candidatus Thermoplasmatota archaeon]